MTAFKIVMGAAAVWSMLAIFATEREPPRPPQIVPVPEEPAALPKADKLAIIEPAPVPVPPPEPMALATAADIEQSRAEKPRERNERSHQRNEQTSERICTRHGLHKVVTRGGKSWRCMR